MNTEDEMAARLAEMMDPGAGVKVDPSKIAPSFASPESDSKPENDDSDFKEERDPKGKTIWINTPTFEDQYKRFPETTRMVGPVVAVFDVANPEQLKELNALLSKQQPEHAPSIILARREENFHEGKWLMLLEYFRVEYKQLITTS
jgi:hypothetical protein